ncbi:AAA domain-containing protein [Thalassoglobus sp. JC818]|uniref:AAA domain-containing protein n=1 Tax=Thalassoglobus sp. JC818 TaxID=3232136 RepID=UPI003457E79B
MFYSGDYFGDVDARLFIKNLENVQGDERDVIFLSMGYGFNDSGKFTKSFGPINLQNGERRLNVAVTRAREELVFVTSVRSADMDLSGSKSTGAHLLKAYLNYAEKGVDTLGLAINEFAAEADSPFEEEVAAALIRRGLDPVPQVGCGGFRIDLALKHPERPGEFCLAVECDGATYHSSNTARDRDRIRQTILENLGWRIVRIWSTDWIRDPNRQINRIIAEYNASVALSPPQYQSHSEAFEEDEFEPQYVEPPTASKRPNFQFNSIDDVPDSVIQSTAEYVLTQAGAMAFDDLVKQTSRELGFRRLSVKIKSRLEARLDDDLKSGLLKRLGERVIIGEFNK